MSQVAHSLQVLIVGLLVIGSVVHSVFIVATDTGTEEGRRKAWLVAACFKAELELMPPRRITMAKAVVS